MENLLAVIQEKFEVGEVRFDDPDQAILLANALVEISPHPRTERDQSIHDRIVNLLQRCMDYLG